MPFNIQSLPELANSVVFSSYLVSEFMRLILDHVELDIADVTNFVHPGTPLDDEASKRGTSVYLVERRIDMLPKPLTEGNIFLQDKFPLCWNSNVLMKHGFAYRYLLA